MFRLPCPLALLLAVVALASACSPPSPDSGDHSDGDSNNKNPFELGSGAYPPPETIGFKINHACLNVNNLTASMHFYTEVLGMNHIFTLHATGYFKIAYLGHVSGGVNGSGYQTPEELLREKNNQKGLLELVWVDPDVLARAEGGSSGGHKDGDTGDDVTLPPLAGSTQKSSTLSHLGLVVADVPAVQERVLKAGVEVVKKVGEPVSGDRLGPVAVSYGLDRLPAGEETEKLLAAILGAVDGTGNRAFLMINDPDGNLIEVQPLIEEALA